MSTVEISVLTVKLWDDMTPSAIFKVMAVKNGNKPQIGISLIRLLIIIDLNYLPRNIWFW